MCMAFLSLCLEEEGDREEGKGQRDEEVLH